MFLWYSTHTPLASVILITVIDMFGFYPTFRKSYYKPNEETISTFMLSGIAFLIAIIALQKYSVVTWLYPASLVIMNLGLVGLLTSRKNYYKK
jgi:hypothetical protein